jgi:NADH/F420H2 dehydrogenase subunit C
MSAQPAGPGQAPTPATDELRQEFRTRVFQVLAQTFQAELEPADRWGLTVVLPGSRLRDAVAFLRDSEEFRLDMMVDITAIDYLGYPGHDQARFAVVYNLKSTAYAAHRLRLKVRVEEESASVPSVHDLFAIANWQERETWDQYGIAFDGHPDLRRLLNHIEFVGHPLRKDYPARKRQWLSTNDPLVAPLDARLRGRGFEVLEGAGLNSPTVEETGLLGKPSVEKINVVGRHK